MRIAIKSLERLENRETDVENGLKCKPNKEETESQKWSDMIELIQSRHIMFRSNVCAFVALFMPLLFGSHNRHSIIWEGKPLIPPNPRAVECQHKSREQKQNSILFVFAANDYLLWLSLLVIESDVITDNQICLNKRRMNSKHTLYSFMSVSVVNKQGNSHQLMAERASKHLSRYENDLYYSILWIIIALIMCSMAIAVTTRGPVVVSALRTRSDDSLQWSPIVISIIWFPLEKKGSKEKHFFCGIDEEKWENDKKLRQIDLLGLTFCAILSLSLSVAVFSLGINSPLLMTIRVTSRCPVL